MCFRNGCGQLSRDGKGVPRRELTVFCKVGRQRHAFQKFHGQEVDLASRSLRRVDLVDHANIRVAHFQRTFEFGRKRLAKSEFGRFDADPLAALAIESFVDHAHAALAHLANDFKSAGDNLAGLKGPVKRRAGDERFAKEVAHPLFPIDGLFHFTKKFQVTPAFVLEERDNVRSRAA